VKLLYFAWLRTRIGIGEETVEPPAEVRTVADLLEWLPTRGPRFAEALADRNAIRVAVNQDYAKPADPIGAGDEVALFPPVTGG
jgi:molybdopterin synthase sulfur carrier subunit